MLQSVIEYILNNGKEKSRCVIHDSRGIEFRVGNFVCDNRVYFVVFANSKVIECMEIATDHPTEKGGAKNG
jgi:hypothetical protein